MEERHRTKRQLAVLRFDDGFNRVHQLAVMALGAITVIVTGIVIYQVCVRYFFGRPSVWTLDLATMMMVPLTYLAAGYVSRLDAHVSVDFVTRMLPRRVRRVVEFLRIVIQLVFASLLVWLGFLGMLNLLERGYLSGSAGLPLWTTAVAIPIGALFFAIELLIQAAKMLVGLSWQGHADDDLVIEGGI